MMIMIIIVVLQEREWVFMVSTVMTMLAVMLLFVGSVCVFICLENYRRVEEWRSRKVSVQANAALRTVQLHAARQYFSAAPAGDIGGTK